MTALWRSGDVVQATGSLGNGDWQAAGVSIDSRTVVPGDLFIALKGPNFDGHDYVDAALGNGAAAAIVSDGRTGPRIVRVGDTMQALRSLGQAARERTHARIAAITGSVGKTGTKEALRHVLSSQGQVHASVGSFNNDFGVPLSLARMPQETGYAIFEIGMNSFGEIARQARQVRPHVAVVTNIFPVHIEHLGSVEAIANEKADIFTALEPGGVAIFGDDVSGEAALLSKSPANRLRFGAGDAEILEFTPEFEGSQVTARIGDRAYSYFIPAAGRHMAENSLAVLLTVQALGADVEQAAAAYATLPALAGRGKRQSIATSGGGTATLIDESYNASPASMEASLKVLGLAPQRRIAVLGDMLELGPESPAFHAGLASAIEHAGVDSVYLSGANMAHLYNALPQGLRGAHTGTSEELAYIVADAVKDGDVVLVKGSNGSRMKLIVETLMKRT